MSTTSVGASILVGFSTCVDHAMLVHVQVALGIYLAMVPKEEIVAPEEDDANLQPILFREPILLV